MWTKELEILKSGFPNKMTQPDPPTTSPRTHLPLAQVLLQHLLWIFWSYLSSKWTPTVLLRGPCPCTAPANAKGTNASPARRAAAPADPRVLPRAPRACTKSAKGHQTSADAEPDVGKASSHMEKPVFLNCFLLPWLWWVHSCFYEIFLTINSYRRRQ